MTARTPENIDKLLGLISEGMSLNKACREHVKDVKVPTFLSWCQKDEELAERYARARIAGCEVRAEEIIDIAKRPLRLVNDRVDHGEIAARKVQIDALKWVLAKQQPQKYGDRVALAGDRDSPLNPAYSETERKARLDALFAKVEERVTSAAETGQNGTNGKHEG